MNISLNLSKPKLKILSAVCSNFIVVWILAMFATNNLTVLTFNFVGVIVFWRLGVSIEEQLENI